MAKGPATACLGKGFEAGVVSITLTAAGAVAWRAANPPPPKPAAIER